MSRHAHFEEISDSDPDPDDMDPSDFEPSTSIINPSQPVLQPQSKAPPAGNGQDRAHIKRWQCVYPVYFDANRSRADGRRVGKELAVQNPLAREIADAVQVAGLNVAFEAGSTHPKDWANPGRVKVHMRDDNGKLKNPRVKNKHHLYILIANYLKAHPTTERTPLRLPIAGLPSDKPLPSPNLPRGWKMSSILPLHSPAVSGGGVSENMFKEMMQEMQGGTGGGAQAQIDERETAGEKKKKDRKKKKN